MRDQTVTRKMWSAVSPSTPSSFVMPFGTLIKSPRCAAAPAVNAVEAPRKSRP